MKRISIYILASILFCTTSCSKWLEVKPEDRFTEDQIFETEVGFDEAMNGLYLGLAKDNLYGDKMTLTTVELLANRFHVLESSSPYMSLCTWNYNANYSLESFSNIWSQAYTSIGNANNLLAALDKQGTTVLPDAKRTRLKGEALAIRAYVHLDLLRLFGPVYNSVDSTKNAIPYYTQLSPDIETILPANQAMTLILKDINQALDYLKDDNSVELGYKNYTNYRFNYVAAMALKTRALLWRNNKDEAFKLAKETIALTDNFTWVTIDQAKNPTNPDRIFVNEMLFGVYNDRLYLNYDKYFSFELEPKSILSSGSATFIENIYEKSSNDYRFETQWKIPSYGVSYPTFFKFADITDKTGGYRQRFTIPLLRKSELYYIAAETAASTADGLVFLNKIRNQRGLSSLSSASQISNEIYKEYLKEFYGEGQVWYYYKRNRISAIVSPNGDKTSAIPSNAWVIPLPLNETDNR